MIVTRRELLADVGALVVMSDDEIARLLKRKQEIDALAVDRFTHRQQWLAEAVELLLRNVAQLRTDLRDNGIIR
jgi:hypothetical protein